jgi:cytochrome P450
VEPVSFNPFDPEFRRDPVPSYRRLREEDPTHHSPLGVWVLTRYDDCLAVLRHPHASSDARNSSSFQDFFEHLNGEDAEALSDMRRLRPFLFMDPPDHTRLRGLVAKAFTPRVVEGLRPRVQSLVDELLDAVAERGDMELIEDLAYPLPVRVISEMLGVPPEDHETFKGWSRELARSLDPDFMVPADVLERRRQAVLAFHDYFRALIAERRARPSGDLLSALIAAEDEGHRLTEDEVLSTCTLLLVAGHETTVNLIGNGMLALLRHPDELARLRDDPSLARSGVEELLRYDPPVTMTARIAMEDIEVGGITVEAGAQAILLLGAANRDPAQFADPDRLDLARPDNHHVAFGHGIHFCLGAPLARVEGQIALTEVARRFPDLELAADEPEYKENIVLRGLASLPLQFTPAVAGASR